MTVGQCLCSLLRLLSVKGWIPPWDKSAEYNREPMFFNSHRLAATLLFLVAFSVFGGEVRVAQLVAPDYSTVYRNYPGALSGLLSSIHENTGLEVAPDPVMVSSFRDPRLRECPFLYVNWDDRNDWEAFPEEEHAALREFLKAGGFMYVDAGIATEFLREAGTMNGQHHSYAEWEARPDVKEFFARTLPEDAFAPLGRDDPLYSCPYRGLPDASALAPGLREYVSREKWPNGTYSAVGIRLDGRLAVLATPVVAMGWGKDDLGDWTTEIRLRTLEDGEALGEILPDAAVLGPRYAARREDGGVDDVFCQQDALPAWLHDPLGRWRVFRYYDSRQISDFAHVFYTRLATNFIVCALLGE